MGLAVSVVEAADRILSRVASPPIAKSLADLHRSQGVSLHTGISVDQITVEQGAFSGLTLTDGTVLKGEILVVGIGVRPDSDLARKAGIQTEHSNGGAVLVDASMRTSNPDIIAIGDVALKRGNSPRIESVHNQNSAARAAAAIMGQPLPVVETPRFWSDQYDASL